MYFRLKNYPATREIMGYSEEEIDFACEYFEECGSIPQTVKDLGYPDSKIAHQE